MSKILILAEKPSVGKEIARVMGCRRNGGGYLSGDKYIVTWALGHLVTLAEPEYYGNQYKTWSIESLPMMPNKMELKVIPETAKQYNVVKTLMRSSEVSSLIIATDAGREGELVARWIMIKAGFNKPVKRLWISSQTDRAIQQGFASLKDGKGYMNLYQSAECRAEADWLVGLNVTRALTCKYNAQLSAGRVQTPTLAIIAQREEEIKKFVPKDFYTVNADLGKFFVTYKDAKNQSALFDKDRANSIADKIKNKPFKITEVRKTPKATPPPMLYDLTELQRDANKMYQYSPKQTLSIMQRLYESHKALTYPRTDSRYLTTDIVPTLTERLRAVSMGEFTPIVTEIIRDHKTIARACINNAKVSDHHAIIPTEQKINVMNLSSEEKRIYLLVVKRFLTCFYPNYEYKQIKIELICEGERFFAGGREITNQGWKRVYDTKEDIEDHEQTLPAFQQGDVFKCQNIQVKASKTSPPARYTEATLLTAMENPSRFIDDQKMKEFIGAGLGTPATRADIIEKLFSSFYVEKHGTSLAPTSKGMQLISLVPTDLKEPLLTAKWEQQLDAIKNGAVKKATFISEIKAYTGALVKKVVASEQKYVHDNMTKEVCPECGKFMLRVTGKKGKMYVCQDRECGFRKNISMITKARCPNCHKTMELFGDGEKKSYVCRCGFREKADKFAERVGAQGANKRAVQDYLKNQQPAKPEKTAFALALEKSMKGK